MAGNRAQVVQVLQTDPVLVVQQCRRREGGVGTQVRPERVGSQCAPHIEPAVVDQPTDGGRTESRLMGHPRGVGVLVGRGAPPGLPARPQDHRRTPRDRTVAPLPRHQIRHGQGVVGVGGGLPPDVDLHRGQEQVGGVELIGEQAALLEMSRGAPVGSGVLPLLDVLQVEAVRLDGGRGLQGEWRITGEDGRRGGVVHV